MKKLFSMIGFVLISFAFVSLATGSQVADVAKKEKERREKIEKADTTKKKTFTNQDIAEFKAKHKDAEGTATTDDSADNSADDSSNLAIPPDTSVQDEEAWKQKFNDANSKIQELQARVDELQTNINGLRGAFVAESDGVAAKPQIGAELGAQMTDLDQAKQALAAAQQAMEDLQEEARKAGAPPGWVRE